MTQDEEDTELRARGKIEVVIQRGKEKKRRMKESEMQDAQLIQKFMLPEETSKKVAQDEGRSHFLKYASHCLSIGSLILISSRPVILHEVDDNHDQTKYWYDWTPAKDAAGEEIRFTFYYTSRSKSRLLVARSSSCSLAD